MLCWCLQLQIANLHEYLLDRVHYFHRRVSGATNTPGLGPGYDFEEFVSERASFKCLSGFELVLDQLRDPLTCLLVVLRFVGSLPETVGDGS